MMTDDSRKRKRQYDFDDMATLCSPMSPIMGRGPAQRRRRSLEGTEGLITNDLDLELSFASTMSLNSPQLSPIMGNFATSGMPLSPVAMDISPAPITRVESHRRSIDASATLASPMRKRANTVRSFGRELSNGGNPTATISVSFKDQAVRHTERSPLPNIWMCNDGHEQLASNSTSDAMDVDQSMIAPDDEEYDVNLSSPPPASLSARASNADFSNLFFDDMSPARKSNQVLEYAQDNQVAESNKQAAVRFVDYQQSSSPAPQHSSPMERKYERFASTGGGLFGRLGKPALVGIGVSDIPEKKRPRRPTILALMRADTAPVGASESILRNEYEEIGSSGFLMPRRAVSDAAAHSLMESAASGDPDVSSDAIPELSSPAAQVVAKRAMRTVRRCEGTDDFRPMKHDLNARLERNSPRTSGSSPNGSHLLESPSARWFKGAGMPGFGDNEAHGKVLPCHRVPEDGLMRIDCQTLNALIDGRFNDKVASYTIIDCRFDYEYAGGHIPGAININTTTDIEQILLGEKPNKPAPSCSGDQVKKTVLVFHCEFSAKRAPTFAKHLRSRDRAVNNHVYPRIHYPEIYILNGGYCQYFKESGVRCVPPAYVRMDDPAYLQDRREDLGMFRKAKFGRTRSYAYGELTSRGPAPAQPSQPQRSTAPTGGGTLSTVYAAANAARARRSASGGENKAAILSTLEEASHVAGMSDEDCSFVSMDSVDHSPCPAPVPRGGSGIGGAAFLAAKKKLIGSNRTLQRSQTFAHCR